jgi:hypothetical protein
MTSPMDFARHSYTSLRLGNAFPIFCSSCSPHTYASYAGLQPSW